MVKRSRSAVWFRASCLMLATVAAILCGALGIAAQDTERVVPIKAQALPDEKASSGVTKYSFIAYGDTRGR